MSTPITESQESPPEKYTYWVNAPKPPLSTNPVFTIVAMQCKIYLDMSKNGREIQAGEVNSDVLKKRLMAALAGDLTALAAALKYIIEPLSYVEHEEGDGIPDYLTTRQWIMLQLKRSEYTKEEIALFMESYPLKETFPFNDFFKAAVVKGGLIVFNNYLETLMHMKAPLS
jgi:hypothetical protein